MRSITAIGAYAATSTVWQNQPVSLQRKGVARLLWPNSFPPSLLSPRSMSTEEGRKRKRSPFGTSVATSSHSSAFPAGVEGPNEMSSAGDPMLANEHAEQAIMAILSSVAEENGDLPSSWLLDVCKSLEGLTSEAKDVITADDGAVKSSQGTTESTDTVRVEPENSCASLELRAAHGGIAAASSLRDIALHYGPSKGKGRNALRSVSSTLDKDPLAAIVIASALAVGTGDEDGMALGRAAASAVIPNGRYDNSTRGENTGKSQKNEGVCSEFGAAAVKGLLQIVVKENVIATHVAVDLHIVTAISRAFVEDTTSLAPVCVKVLKKTLLLNGDDNTENDAPRLTKNTAAPSLALAAQLSPFLSMSPVPLIERAVGLDLWHVAERLCDSALGAGSNESVEAVQTLVDAAFDQHLYRQADAMTWKFYETGGQSRYAEARLEHACDTISKVIQRRQLPVIERQIERVDKAFERVFRDLRGSKDDSSLLSEKEEGKLEVRTFALRRLRESNQNDFAHRLAKLYGMPYHYSAEDAAKDEKERRERYLQFDDALDTEVPNAISTPDALRRSFSIFEREDKGVIGFDVEWADDAPGAALLQISTIDAAILVDIPALSGTQDGKVALEDTVGKMFAGPRGSVIGFGCKEDLSRLRSSPCPKEINGGQGTHWLAAGTSATIDLRVLIAEDKPSLRHLGLSKSCNHYLGKPLDKAEQCSLWTRRPLSMEQRVYAALDAWACTAIHSKLSCSSN